MARIPEHEIERIKTEIQLTDLCQKHGIELKKHGTSDFIGLCPFHNDHDPSFVVTPSKNLFHCLGCGEGGSPIDFMMKLKKISFRHAVELFRDPELKTVKEAKLLKLDNDHELMSQVIAYYHQTLKESPEAIKYLESRGLQNAELIDHFKLGFANRSLGYRLPPKDHKAGRQVRAQLQKIGVCRESGHEHFNGSIVVPIFNEEGLVTEIYGRKITPKLRKGTPDHLYLPGPHSGIWNYEAFKASKEIILCESLIDAMTFWCAGYRNVTCSYGTQGFNGDHLKAFKQYIRRASYMIFKQLLRRLFTFLYQPLTL